MLRLPVTLAALLLPCALAMPASAAEPKLDCSKAMNTIEMNQCADRDYAAADAKLNAAYQKALNYIKSTENPKPYDAAAWEKALRASQTAWIAFRDADCKGLVPMSWTGGTGTTVAVLGCMTEKTELRTKELTAITDEN
jgi:uncharacterized protein YecT (DUF1311 family)